MPRRVLISGGTGAIGTALVRRFAACGDDVAFTFNRSSEQAATLERETGAVALHHDLEGEFAPPQLEPEVLINNAGVNLSGHGLQSTTDDEVLRTLTVNVLGPLRLCRHYAPAMVSAGFGRIININSLWGLTAPANRTSYAMSKHALRALTQSLAHELGPHGVTVNDICPGPVESAMLREMGTAAVEAGRFRSVDEYLDDVRGEMPTQRLVEADEIAAVAEFLSSPSAGSCNGIALRVDGALLP